MRQPDVAMATLRNPVIGVLCRAGAAPVNVAALRRHARHARHPRRPLGTLGITPGSSYG